MESKNLTNKYCQCCGMPLNEEVVAHEPNGEVNDEYCKWCYHDGEFVYHSIDELIDACIPHMVAQGFNEEEARSFMKANFPNLKYWRNR